MKNLHQAWNLTWYNLFNMKDLKLIVCAVLVFVVVAILMFVVSINRDSSRAHKLYEQGLEFYQEQDYQNAYYNFSKISCFSKLYQLSLLKQAQCALNIGDKKTAYSKFKHLGSVSKDPYLAPLALFNAALINMEHKKYHHAYKKLKKLYKNYPDSDYQKASCYLFGLLYKQKNPHLAKDYFLEYLEYAPGGRYSKNAIDELSELNLYLNNSEKYILANAFYENALYEKALAYSKDLDLPLSAMLSAKIYEYSGNKDAALEYYKKAIMLSDETVKPEQISFLVEKFTTLSPLSKKDACAILVKQTKKTVAYPAVLFEYAKYLPKMSSVKCWQLIYNKYPQSYWAPQSLWNVFLYNYELGYIKKSKELAQLHINSYKNKLSTPAMKFWHAKILLDERKLSAARQEFKELIKTHPESYYSYVADNILDGKTTPLNALNVGNVKFNSNFNKNDLKQIFNNDKTLILLAELGDIETIKNLRVHDDFVSSYVAYKDGNLPYSIYYAQKGFDLLEIKPQHSDARYKLLYPLDYIEQINENSNIYGQNPYLMLALMREESRFNPKAYSPVGATGLMQLMPATASSLGLGELSVQDLYKPELNIKLGIKYFSDLKNMFEQNEMLSVLSYNGGPYNVMNWAKELEHKSFDEFVEDIPFSETQNYIKKVFGSYWNYVKIYN